jgi:hypothetical protein
MGKPGIRNPKPAIAPQAMNPKTMHVSRWPARNPKPEARNPPVPPLCLYHRNCLDGSAAAAVVALKEPTTAFQPVQYGDPTPKVEGRDVFVVDFGFPLDQMRALRAQAREVVWIDHHASQLATRRSLGWGVLDTDECAASLAWRTLFPDRPAPRLIDYIRDKDLWRWELPNSRAIAAGLMQRFSQSRFIGILDVDLEEMRRLGEPLLAAQGKRIAKVVTTGVAVSEPYGLAKRRCLVVESKHDLSDIGDHICLPVELGGLGFDMSIVLYRKPDGAWVHSLRSRNTVDCAALAEQRGGGGHPNAACYLARESFLVSGDCPAAFRRPTG